MKILANYLPQYHRIPENDAWWGEGYTDWTAVRNARPLYAGHDQPRIPLEGYYDLSESRAIARQVEIARCYGVSGFAIYHYWFNSKMKLLEKPAELLLANPQLDLEYLFLWDNQSWKRTWSQVKRGNDWAPNFDSGGGKAEGILAELQYGGEEDWKKHFLYLLPFFRDDRYMKADGKPLFGFFCANVEEERETLRSMSRYWDRLARENGLPGIVCMGRESIGEIAFEDKFLYSPFANIRLRDAAIHKARDEWMIRTKKIRFYDYDECWEKTLKNARLSDEKTILSGFVNFDDSPRRGDKGRIIRGGSPEKFEKYLRRLLDIADRQGKDLVFLTAWNEWGEGAYLEPDRTDGFAYLEALKRAVE